jgi:hypothetical protein
MTPRLVVIPKDDPHLNSQLPLLPVSVASRRGYRGFRSVAPCRLVSDSRLSRKFATSSATLSVGGTSGFRAPQERDGGMR